jgi:hypothetical protein
MNVKIDRQLYNYGDGSAYFVAPVQLPQGVTIKNVTWYFYDGGDHQIWLNLCRSNQTIEACVVMASHMTQGAPGYGIGYDESINLATVDNTQWFYWLSVTLPYSDTHMDYRFQFAVIEYEYPA